MTPDRIQEIRQRLEACDEAEVALDTYMAGSPITQDEHTRLYEAFTTALLKVETRENVRDLLAALATAEAEGRRQAYRELADRASFLGAHVFAAEIRRKLAQTEAPRP